MTQLTEHFTLEELTCTKYHDLDNTPSPTAINNLTWLTAYALEPLRKLLGKPVHITSGYRGPELNKRVNGAASSHHLCQDGYAAADIHVDGMTTQQLYDFIKAHPLEVPFEQLIQEFNTWVHIALRYNVKKPAYQRLIATRLLDGHTLYTKDLT